MRTDEFILSNDFIFFDPGELDLDYLEPTDWVKDCETRLPVRFGDVEGITLNWDSKDCKLRHSEKELSGIVLTDKIIGENIKAYKKLLGFIDNAELSEDWRKALEGFFERQEQDRTYVHEFQMLLRGLGFKEEAKDVEV